jgi:FlaA1/EpsC-like NDP-sugar epimerase
VIEHAGRLFVNSLLNQLLGMSRAKKRALQVSVDFILIASMLAVAMWIRLENVDFADDPAVWSVLLAVVPITITSFIKLGFYRAVLRYIAGRALRTILAGSVLSALTMALCAGMAGLPIPASVPLIYMMLIFLCTGGIRFGFREVVNFTQNRRKQRVAIYGAGVAGRQLLQMLYQQRDYMPVAFIDDSPAAQGTHVGGLMVYAPRQIERLIRNNGVNVVLLAMPSITKSRRSEILKTIETFPLVIQSVPRLDDIMSGRARIDQINDIGIEDLLGRDPVPPRPELMGANIKGKVVMVTGAGGSIGSELCRQILRGKPRQIVLLELSEPALYTIEQELILMQAKLRSRVLISPVLGCVKSTKLMSRIMRQFAVKTVYHAAAYKHVPLVEQNISEGVRNIVFGSRSVLNAAIENQVEAFILISTDKSVRPTNIMGASKRLAELICQAHANPACAGKTKISMVRFGNVLGSSGSVIPAFRRQIAAGGPITVTHPEITRFFMTIPEAAELVIQAGAMASGGEVFVLDMGDPVRIAELAAKMARMHGLKPVLFADPKTDHAAPGEIGIVFTNLRPGEKLHEELLIGNAPRPTSHPRIMAASEIYQPLSVIEPALTQLDRACERMDIAMIRNILVDLHTDYKPSSEIVDQLWDTGEADGVAANSFAVARHLTLVHG